jgi:hypothetical protein
MSNRYDQKTAEKLKEKKQKEKEKKQKEKILGALTDYIDGVRENFDIDSLYGKIENNEEVDFENWVQILNSIQIPDRLIDKNNSDVLVRRSDELEEDVEHFKNLADDIRRIISENELDWVDIEDLSDNSSRVKNLVRLIEIIDLKLRLLEELLDEEESLDETSSEEIFEDKSVTSEDIVNALKEEDQEVSFITLNLNEEDEISWGPNDVLKEEFDGSNELGDEVAHASSEDVDEGEDND